MKDHFWQTAQWASRPSHLLTQGVSHRITLVVVRVLVMFPSINHNSITVSSPVRHFDSKADLHIAAWNVFRYIQCKITEIVFTNTIHTKLRSSLHSMKCNEKNVIDRKNFFNAVNVILFLSCRIDDDAQVEEIN